MKFGVPWRAKGIRPEARETAIEAARRSGMSLDDWLNSVIMQQAAQAGMQAGPQAAHEPDRRELAAVHNRLDELSRRIEQFSRRDAVAYAPQHQPQSRGPDQRAELIGRLDQYIHNTQPPPMPEQPAPAPRNAPIPHVLDQALADIATRQRALNGAAPPPRRPSSPADYAPPATRAKEAEPASPPLPAQDLSGLEAQLRKITSQIETLRHPGVEEAINALRAELGEIGLALGEAMPRRSIETIEHQIHGLSQRIAEGRQNGIDHNALAGIEHGLMEVRDALHGLTPAENLVGFNEAVAGLAQKIDLIVAQRDPATLAQLESAITTLRGMANHVASNDAVSALAAEVQALADKVDHIAHASANADALSSLEHRIDALAEALAERAQHGNAVSPRLEALVQSLSDKIEQIQAAQAHGEDVAGAHLDDRIAMLVERLDASDSRLGQLEVIERGLSDVLLHIQQSQADGDAAAQAHEALAVDAIKHNFAQAQETLKYDIAQAQEALKSDLVQSQAELKCDIARTQDALHQVHGTLGELVQRLAAIEQSIRNEAPAAVPAPAHVGLPDHADLPEDEPLELPQPVGKVGARLVEGEPSMSAFDNMLPPRTDHMPPPREDQPAAPERIIPEVEAAPIQPAPMAEPELATVEDAGPPYDSLPPAPQLDVQHDALRAEAAGLASAPPPRALQAQPPQSWAREAPAPKRIPPNGPINPDLPSDEPLEPGSGPPPLRTNPAARIAASEAALGHARPTREPSADSKSSFIAAARRAAQAAMQQEPAAAPAPGPDSKAETTNAQPAGGRMMQRVKSLFVAASIVAIVVGSVQIATNVLNLGRSNAPSRSMQKHVSMDRQADTAPRTAATHSIEKAASPTATATLPSSLTATPLALVPPSATIDLLAPPGQTVHTATTSILDPRRAAQTAAPNSASATDITGSIPEAAATGSTPEPAATPSDSADLPIGIGSARLRQAAAAGNAAAAYEVAMRFARGRGVPTNLSRAVRWYERAADKGLAPAQFRLASLFEKGQGVKKDLLRARALYFAAARQGHAKAMHNLAVLYTEGVDGKPDYATAVQWFRKAAQHGVSDSQYNLGILYARGIGVKKSLPESYKWFALAAKHGDKEAAKKRDEVAHHLNAKALAAARRAVAKFVPKPQPHQATSVPAPPGGWDKATAASAAHSARTVNDFVVGKR